MKTILEAIKNKKPITTRQYTKIKKHIILNKKEINDIFNIEEVNNKYYLFIDENDLFQNVFHSYLKEHNSERVQAANLGFSHNARCSQSFLIMKKTPVNNIDVVITPTETKTIKQKALLIENQETFLDHNFINALNIKLTDYEIIYCEGNKITNKHHESYLKQFTEIRCLMDWDVAGLDMYRNLRGKYKNVIWHTEEYFFEIAQRYLLTEKNKINKQYKTQLRKRIDKGTKATIDLLIKRNIKIEQEIFQQGGNI